MHRLLVRIVATYMFLGTAMAYAQPSLTQLQTELISAWVVTLDGEDRTRTLKISGVEQKDAGIFPLNAVYGWSDGNQSAVRAEINQTGQERTLLITTQPGSKITATQKPDGTFVGTFVYPDGTKTKPVRLERVSADQLRAKVEASLKGPAIVKPAADVPPQCAAYSGRWTGTWGYGTGQTWLSVVGVDANCVAKFAYLSHSRSPTGFATAEIKNGDLSIPCGSGTCTFEIHGDEIWGRYSGPEGTNSVVKKKML